MVSAQIPLPIQPQVAPNRPDWENPAVNAIGTLPARASGFPFASRREAMAGAMRRSSRFLSLDGTWHFAFVEDADKRPQDFWRDGFDVSGWKTIPVPSDWQAHGYGQPRYNNITYPFPANRPLIQHSINSVGSYRRDFVLPSAWRGADQAVTLHVGAANSAYYIWINGRRVGYSEDSKLPAEFDATPYLRAGRNNISIQVFRWSDGSYLEDQDFWRVSGIERSVYLYAQPRLHLRDTAIRAGLDAAYRDGTLAVTATVVPGDAATVRAVLLDGRRELWSQAQSVAAGASPREVQLSGTIVAPRAWTAETPNLYTLVTELLGSDGRLLQSTARRIGFRTVEIRDGQVMVNGRPIRIRGVNRHEHDPETFHVISEASMRRDIEMMKQNNVNAVRTSHYPNAELWYDLADEYGLYVLDEANVESHGYMAAGDHAGAPDRYQLGYDPAWQDAHISRMTNMVRRDRNHPSIIFWSLGNESGVGPTFEKGAAAVRALDPTRLVSFLGYGTLNLVHKPNGFVDIYAPMYDTLWKMQDYATDPQYTQPMIQCEYAHAMGNSVGNLQDYWDVIYRYPKLQGGFIWDWVDQGMNGRDERGRFYWKMGGDYGPNPGGDVEFGDGLIHADRRANPHLFELRKVYQPIGFTAADPANGRITLINRQDFAGLSGYRLGWRLAEAGSVIAGGDLADPGIAARGTGTIAVPLPAGVVGNGREHVLTVFARARAGTTPLVAPDTIMAWEQFVLDRAASASTSASMATGTVSAETAAGHAMLRAGGSELSIDTATGLVDHLRFGGRTVLRGGAPNFYRALTDNDVGTGLENTHDDWRTMIDGRRIERVATVRHPDGSAQIDIRYALGVGAARFDASYRMTGDGRVAVSGRFQPLRDNLVDPLRIGLAYSAPAEFTDLRWYGRGRHESYGDRQTGAPIALWEGRIADQNHDYMRPQETGNKVGVRWVSVTGADGRGFTAASDVPLSVNVLAFPYADLMRRPPGTWRSSDIVPHGEVTVQIDAIQTGVGGDTQWDATGRPHGKYRIPLAPLSYGFTLAPAARQDARQDVNALVDLLGPAARAPNAAPR